MCPCSLKRSDRDEICDQLRQQGHIGWLIVYSDGTYELKHLYATKEEALAVLTSKEDPTSPVVGGELVHIGVLRAYVVLCPSCKSIRKAGEDCPLCLSPVPYPKKR